MTLFGDLVWSEQLLPYTSEVAVRTPNQAPAPRK